MKIALFSDIHFNTFKPFATFEDGENSRFVEIIDAFNWACADARERECTHGMVAGDIFHTRGALRPSIFNRVFDTIAEAALYMKFLAIPGNHDMENYRGGYTAIDTFDAINQVQVANEPCVLNLMGTTIEIGCIPYIHDHKEFKKAFCEMLVDHPGLEAMLIHQGIDDFANPGMPELGLTVEWIREQTQIPVIAGHYHKPRLKDRVLSPGSLVQHGFGDSGQHGYWIWDADTGVFEAVPVPGPEFETIATLEDAADMEGKYVRVIGNAIKEAEKIKKAAEDAGAKGVMIKMEKTFTTAHDESIALGSPKDMLTAYIKLKHADKADRLTKLFEKICEGGAA